MNDRFALIALLGDRDGTTAVSCTQCGLADLFWEHLLEHVLGQDRKINI